MSGYRRACRPPDAAMEESPGGSWHRNEFEFSSRWHGTCPMHRQMAYEARNTQSRFIMKRHNRFTERTL